MTRIVRDRYPLSKLPEDLREGLPDDCEVRVVVESTPHGPRYNLEELLKLKRELPVATDDPVQRIRKLRDQWD